MGVPSLERVTVISGNYPEKRFPEKGAFVERLVDQWQLEGVKVDVIAPYSIPNLIRSIKRDKHDISVAGNQIERPIFMSFSNKKFANWDFKKLSDYCFRKAAIRGIGKISKPDIFYGKFLMKGGHAALRAGKKYNIPVVADLGESRLLERMSRKEIELARKIVPQFDGIVCVSKRLVDEVRELGAHPDQVLYAPNTVDTARFHPMDKKKCRAKLNLPNDRFLVIFVGHFIDRKGPNRVLEAINSLNKNVQGVFLGRGSQKPDGNKVLHAGSVPNSELPIWLNAADVFALPTLAEGYCNAINEAMACGLPIVSSDIPDIHPQVTNKMGILVDPLDVEKIAQAIRTLFDNKYLLHEFSKECLRESKGRFKKSRAANILHWLKAF